MEGRVEMPLHEYNKLHQANIDLEHDLEAAQVLQENLLDYQERLEKAIIRLIAAESNYGKYGWILREKFSDLVSIMDLWEYDFSKLEPEPTTTEVPNE